MMKCTINMAAATIDVKRTTTIYFELYDDENYVVTGVPQTVNVTIKGPTGTVKKVRQVKDFEIYADMLGVLCDDS